jgi:outer membrane protein insertion porin family
MKFYNPTRLNVFAGIRMSILNHRKTRRALRNGLGMALCVGLLSACNVTKHLDTGKGERLLVKNGVEIKAPEKLRVAQRTTLSYELGSFYRQQPNQRTLYLFRTRLWFYYKFQNRNSKFAKWIKSKFAEPPEIYDSAETKRTAKNFENQMHKRGYLNATCSYKMDSIGQAKAAVQYTLNLGRLYNIDSVYYTSRDSAVLEILNFTKDKTLLLPGEPLDNRTFDAEKLRITSEMKNRGYAYFLPDFVEFAGDSTGANTVVTVEVTPPGDSATRHKTYTLGKIAVFSSLVPDVSSIRSDTTLNGLYFATSEPVFQVKPKRLYESIALRPDWPYRQIDFDKTARDLNALGVFRFVSVRPYLDSINPGKIDVAISLAPNRRFSFGYDFELNTSTSPSALAGRLLGIAGSVTARNRNIFSGAENLTTNLQYNIEFGNADTTGAGNILRRLIFSQEFKLQNEIVFPRYFDYLRMWRTFHKIKFGSKRLIKDALYLQMRDDGKVRLSANYNYLQLFGFYSYNLVNFTYGIDLRTDARRQYSIDHIGIDLLRPKTEAQFESVFGQNQFLKNSFGNQLFTGFFLRSFTYSYAGLPNDAGVRWTRHLNFELSGLEEYVVNRLWAIPFGKQTWRIGDIDFAKFTRLDFDIIRTRDLNKKGLSSAFRFGAGVAVPFGSDSASVPYVKQFFLGGPSSIRAWRIRQLGPGGYYDPKATQPYYQSGDFRLEFNAELRFPMFWWIKGAVFIDGGNIWTLKDDAQRPGARLSGDFYKNIAIGTGVGIRADFDYFILRIDLGYPLRRPYRDPVDNKYWIPKRLSNLAFVPNLAVGYPF